MFPAQVVAEALSNHHILFVGGGLKENRFFDHSHFASQEISTATFRFSNPIKMASGGCSIIKGIWQSRKILLDFMPDLVVGFGSFHTLPLLLAATHLKIPLILYEQNAILGKVNRLFSRFAKITTLNFPIKIAGNSQLVHFPLRHRKKIEDPWRYFGLKKGRPTLLIFGGSQGAARLNEIFLDAIPFLSAFQFLHFTGSKWKADKELYKNTIHYLKPFEPNLMEAMSIADLAICRAGAATLSELIASETPAVLIPFPHATDNHQEINARYFPGGEVLLEKDLNGKKLSEVIHRFPIEAKRKEIQTFKKKQNSLHLADVIEGVLYG